MRKTGWVKCLDPYPYVPYLGIGFTGSFGHKRVNGVLVPTKESTLCKGWSHMMGRCYNPMDSAYRQYGAKGVHVCERWHSCRAYVHDVQTLTNWDAEAYMSRSLYLDKDYYGSNQYNPEVCKWLDPGTNTEYTGKPVQVGTKIFPSVGAASRHWGVSQGDLSGHLTGLRVRGQGNRGNLIWRLPIKFITKEGYVLRYI